MPEPVERGVFRQHRRTEQAGGEFPPGLAYSYWRVGQRTSFVDNEKARQGNIFYEDYAEGGASEGARRRRSWRGSAKRRRAK
jgi:hypothetical protein